MGGIAITILVLLVVVSGVLYHLNKVKQVKDSHQKVIKTLRSELKITHNNQRTTKKKLQQIREVLSRHNNMTITYPIDNLKNAVDYTRRRGYTNLMSRAVQGTDAKMIFENGDTLKQMKAKYQLEDKNVCNLASLPNSVQGMRAPVVLDNQVILNSLCYGIRMEETIDQILEVMLQHDVLDEFQDKMKGVDLHYGR